MPGRNVAFAAVALACGLVSLLGPLRAAELATAELNDRNGELVGAVTLEDTPHGVLLHATLEGLPPGPHAFHIHTVGRCEPPFTSAGGHFNPESTEHGFRAVRGAHAGDLPNIHVPQSGNLEVENLAAWIRFDDKLFDDDGSAIVIHEGADDYATGPAGNAGARIACGVIKR